MEFGNLVPVVLGERDNNRGEEHDFLRVGSARGSAAQLWDLQRVIDLFRSWDINGDGQVSRGEFRKACGALGLVASNDAGLEEIDALFSRLDPDGSGSIEFKELNALLKQETSWRGAGSKGSFKAKSKPAAKGDGSQTRFNFKTEKSKKRIEIEAAGSASSLASLGDWPHK